MQKILAATVVTLALSAMTLPAVADPLDDAITARRAYYQVVKFNAVPLIKMGGGKIPYDAKKAATFAANLKALSEMTNSAMWPKGSDNVAKKGKTRALPKIWETYPAVTEKSKVFKQAIAELVPVAGKGMADFAGKAKALGAACGACHKEYRAKDL